MATKDELNASFDKLSETALKVKRDRDALLAAAKSTLNYLLLEEFLDDPASKPDHVWGVRKSDFLALRNAIAEAEKP